MPSTSREVAIHGVYILTLTLLFVTVAALTWGLNRIFAPFGLYHFTWYPALFQISLFIRLYGGLSLITYR